ncbi:hypothetical protein BDZ89DRAFT_1041623 [Hymenopellis radicata]|nr:hypothetical protein BDZ89DRAFT_1041623 [Hymenopellis radicata]
MDLSSTLTKVGFVAKNLKESCRFLRRARFGPLKPPAKALPEALHNALSASSRFSSKLVTPEEDTFTESLQVQGVEFFSVKDAVEDNADAEDGHVLAEDEGSAPGAHNPWKDDIVILVEDETAAVLKVGMGLGVIQLQISLHSACSRLRPNAPIVVLSPDGVFTIEEEYQSSVLLERLRTSNFAATDEEISHVRHTILPTVSDDISSIDSKLASLHEVIRSMEEERERLKTSRRRIIDIVVAESYRWRVLHLSDWGGGLNIRYGSLHNRLPRLECLSLDYVQIKPKEQSVFKDCPRLTKLTLGVGTLGIGFPWDQIMELDLSGMDLGHGDEEDRQACMRLIGHCPSLETLSMPEWGSRDDRSAYTAITCSNMRKLSATSVSAIDALTLPRLREASLHPDPVTADYDALYSFKRLLIRSNCLGALTRLSLHSVPLDSPESEHSLHSILSQAHSLAFLNLAVTIEDYDDEMDVSDQPEEQVVALSMNSLKVIPTKTVTFLPLLSSLDIQIHNHRKALSLLYFGPVGSFASTLKARWKGDDTVGLARLKTCHFSIQARHIRNRIYRDTSIYLSGPVAGIFNEAERFIFNALVDDGMDLAIRVTSNLTENVGSNNVVFEVGS